MIFFLGWPMRWNAKEAQHKWNCQRARLQRQRQQLSWAIFCLFQFPFFNFASLSLSLVHFFANCKFKDLFIVANVTTVPIYHSIINTNSRLGFSTDSIAQISIKLLFCNKFFPTWSWPAKLLTTLTIFLLTTRTPAFTHIYPSSVRLMIMTTQKCFSNSRLLFRLLPHLHACIMDKLYLSALKTER